MVISFNWLKQYISLPETAEEIGNLLTGCGLEVESIEKLESVKGNLQGMVIGEVLTCSKHPDADRLSITTVDIGNGIISPIVCGAPNVAVGQKVVVATIGAMLYPTNGEPFIIKKSKIRGEVSEGMICAEDEIGIGNSHDGIFILNTDLPNGTPAVEYFKPETDYIFEIGLTPNRADAASHFGVVRDIKALLERDYKLPSVDHFKISNKNFPINVEIENSDDCPRYCGLSIQGVSIKESPAWLKKRLKSISLTPINNIVDITNFVLHELGQPLHAFDADKIKGKKIIVKKSNETHAFQTLDKQERKLFNSDLLIFDEENPVGIAGVMGGLNSAVNNETKNIFIESAYFSPQAVRKSSNNHGLKTDASFRFERGTDPNMTVYALKRAALLVLELAGGEISSELIDVYPNVINDFQIQVSYKNIDRLIGKKLDSQLIKKILINLNIHIIAEDENELSLLVPPYKVDVQREADIIEEILRIYGLDNVELSENIGTSYLADFPKIDKEKIQFDITQLLAGSGFQEIMTNSLTKQSYSKKFPTILHGDDVEILNKLSEDLGIMRQTMLFSGLEVLSYNINRKQKDLKLFEFGKTYHHKEDKYQENKHLSLFMTGDQHHESWMEKSKNLTFHDLAQVVNKVLGKLKIQKYDTRETNNDIFGFGLCFYNQNVEIVNFGRVKVDYSKFAECKQTVWFADFNWDYILKQNNNSIMYTEISKFPEVRRDLSLVLDKKVSFAEIKSLALKTEKNLLKKTNVFDVYEGENIGVENKSYSVSFFLQDEKQTLTDAVIDKTMQKLIQVFEKDLNAVIRK